MKARILFALAALLGAMLLWPILVSGATFSAMPVVLGIRLEFLLFALTLAGVALFHNRTMYVALVGLTALLLIKMVYAPEFSMLQHFFGSQPILQQFIHKELRQGEWPTLLNLVGLLLGFSILAKYFQDSKLPDWLPKVLPDDWKGGLILLFLVFVLSSFLDNIAAALIGGSVAIAVYKGRVHIGFLAAIVAASNAGGAGSVLGDTTTTLMWIDGVNPLDVTHAFIASLSAFLIFGVAGALQQDKYQKIQKDAPAELKVDPVRLIVVLLILIAAIFTNFYFDLPALGVWLAILIGNFLRKAPWCEIRKALQGTIFLTALVSCASLMPVNELPAASWQTTMGLGFVSAVFDNIPLTKLCLDQGGYDWAMLAYAVGFGGSMIWFGSSAGVALSNMFPQAKSLTQYVKNGWHVIVAYVFGFVVLLATIGWQPHAPHHPSPPSATPQEMHVSTGANAR